MVTASYSCGPIEDLDLDQRGTFFPTDWQPWTAPSIFFSRIHSPSKYSKGALAPGWHEDWGIALAKREERGVTQKTGCFSSRLLTVHLPVFLILWLMDPQCFLAIEPSSLLFLLVALPPLFHRSLVLVTVVTKCKRNQSTRLLILRRALRHITWSRWNQEINSRTECLFFVSTFTDAKRPCPTIDHSTHVDLISFLWCSWIFDEAKGPILASWRKDGLRDQDTFAGGRQPLSSFVSSQVPFLSSSADSCSTCSSLKPPLLSFYAWVVRVCPYPAGWDCKQWYKGVTSSTLDEV